MNKPTLWLMVLALVAGCERPPSDRTSLEVAGLLGSTEDAERYARALEVRPFRFPRDHASHPEFRNEWWYLTGHLWDEDDNLYGYQATFFRIAVAPGAAAVDSEWGTHQLWMAHAAVTHVTEGSHREVERFARGALGLAGAQRDPVRVWLGDWQLSLVADDRWRLALESAEFALAFDLASRKPTVLQGDRGLSRKSETPGNASYYYSQTRLATAGTLTVDGEERTVSGLSWLDREWSTSALAPEQVGWDWFSLQLEGRRELMFYRLRTADGAAHAASQGVWVAADGSSQRIGADDMTLTPLRFWRSQQGRRYPVAWSLRHPGLAIDWQVRAVLPEQEMNLLVTYWEGLVEVLDDTGKLIGHGYLEMTGY